MAYGKYIHNFYSQIPRELQSLDRFLEGMPEDLWIVNAFVWGSSKEDLCYWESVSIKWRQKLKNREMIWDKK